jgi:hypothetical protein
MSETTQAAPSRGFFRNLLDLYFSPREAFDGILRAPRLGVSVAAYLAVGLLFTAVWMNNMDPRVFMKSQMEDSGQWEKMNAEQRAAVLDAQARFFPIFGWLFATLVPIVVVLGVAGVLLFVFRFFYASEVTFSQAVAVVAWSFLAAGLVTVPLTLLVMQLRGDWNLNPQEVLAANPTLLLEKGSTAKPLWVLVGSLDLFSLWRASLLAAGFGVASKRSTGSAFWGVAACWGLFVLGQAALAFLR